LKLEQKISNIYINNATPLPSVLSPEKQKEEDVKQVQEKEKNINQSECK
jgi:hypothetical protein